MTTISRQFLTRAVGFSLACALALPATGLAAQGKACSALAGFKLAGHNLEITSAREVPAGPMAARPGGPPMPPVMLPAHCLVDGVIDRRTGRDGKPYAIGFSVALPANWNGRFYYQGGGGLNGVINPPVGMQYAGDTPALGQGFAIASTDSGHQGAGFDASFLADQEAALNFLYQANAKVTVVAKALVAEHYGRPAHHSYWVGCSTGGREGMIMSQRFPDYFDGIVAGAPAMRTNYSNLALRWIATQLNAIAPKDAEGRPQTGKALSDSDRKLIVDGFVASCDARDGLKDGLVFAPQGCSFSPKDLVCKGDKAEGCLSAAQAEAVTKGLAGPKTSSGHQVYPGFMYDTGLNNSRGLPGLLVGPVIPEGPASSTSMDVDAAAAAAHDARAMLGDTNAWTNLSSFRGRGGKLIFFHGVSDPWFSALETVDYYQRLAKDNQPARTEDWSRLFLVPGMGHCAGGERTVDRFNMVDAIVNWVENNRAPDQVIAQGASMPGVTRPLCPFPKHPHFDGTGDPNAAASFSCRE
jgi:feruloyl esterase